jgi:hypothetical protein
MFRFDFESGTQFAWTGPYALAVSGSGDSLCDGHTFDPVANGVPIDIGANQFSYSGSEALPVSVAIPDPPTDAMQQAVNDRTEWQGRTCVMWRVVMSTPPTATAPAQYVIQRVRVGKMDELRINNDGTKHIFTVIIEAHASMISQATNSTYLDQKTKYDSSDTSQDYAMAIANNPRTPSRTSSGSHGGFGSGSGGGGGGFGGLFRHSV